MCRMLRYSSRAKGVQGAMTAGVVYAAIDVPPADEIEIQLALGDPLGLAITGVLKYAGDTIAEIEIGAATSSTTVLNYVVIGKGCGSKITFTPTVANASTGCFVNISATGYSNGSL